jgi:hypothetical protein
MSCIVVEPTCCKLALPPGLSHLGHALLAVALEDDLQTFLLLCHTLLQYIKGTSTSILLAQHYSPWPCCPYCGN